MKASRKKKVLTYLCPAQSFVIDVLFEGIYIGKCLITSAPERTRRTLAFSWAIPAAFLLMIRMEDVLST